MARPRKSDSIINGIVEQFTRQLAGALSGFIATHSAAAATGKRGRRAGRGHGRRGRVLCYYPGCKNLAAPRFGMFCAAEHKDLSKSEKDKYRAMHDKAAGKNRALAARHGRRK
jgi:hypothetical protein